MNEYILVSCKKKHDDLSVDQWINRYFIQKSNHNDYDDLLFQEWCYPFDEIDQLLFDSFKDRCDYKKNEHLHSLYNQLTKEIVIIITNRYQIVVKCDKIPIGVVKTVRNYYPNIRLFCRNKDIEEVET